MFGLDTNVLARYYVREGGRAQAQEEAARNLIERGGPLFVPKTVLLELEWVLRYSYALDGPTIIHAISALLDMKRVVPEDESAVREALTLMAKSIDFADALHLASSSACKDMATFDQAFAKKAKRAGRGRVALS